MHGRQFLCGAPLTKYLNPDGGRVSGYVKTEDALVANQKGGGLMDYPLLGPLGISPNKRHVVYIEVGDLIRKEDGALKHAWTRSEMAMWARVRNTTHPLLPQSEGGLELYDGIVIPGGHRLSCNLNIMKSTNEMELSKYFAKRRFGLDRGRRFGSLIGLVGESGNLYYADVHLVENSHAKLPILRAPTNENAEKVETKYGFLHPPGEMSLCLNSIFGGVLLV